VLHCRLLDGFFMGDSVRRGKGKKCARERMASADVVKSTRTYYLLSRKPKRRKSNERETAGGKGGRRLERAASGESKGRVDGD